MLAFKRIVAGLFLTALAGAGVAAFTVATDEPAADKEDAPHDLDPSGAAARGQGFAPVEEEKAFGWQYSITPPGTGGLIVSPTGDTTAAVSFEVPDGAALLTVEASWTCTSPSCDLTLRLWPPDDGASAVDEAQGTGTGTMEAAAPAPGVWQVTIQGADVTTDVDGAILFGVA